MSSILNAWHTRYLNFCSLCVIGTDKSYLPVLLAFPAYNLFSLTIFGSHLSHLHCPLLKVPVRWTLLQPLSSVDPAEVCDCSSSLSDNGHSCRHNADHQYSDNSWHRRSPAPLLLSDIRSDRSFSTGSWYHRPVLLFLNWLHRPLCPPFSKNIKEQFLE